MFDRQLLGDIGLAILLALPTAALARPEPVTPTETVSTPQDDQTAAADRAASERRVSLLG